MLIMIILVIIWMIILVITLIIISMIIFNQVSNERLPVHCLPLLATASPSYFKSVDQVGW